VIKKILLLAVAMFSTTAFAAAPDKPAAPSLPPLSAAQVVDKNISARGGLDKWRSVTTLTLSGTMEAGGTKNASLPFTMKMKRGHKSRLEIQFQNQTAVQVFNGKQGWKQRPFLGRDDVEPYTSAEAKQAEATEELDGPLIDYARKGSTVALAGTDTVDGHASYVLQVTDKHGAERKVWIAADTFLEVKMEAEPRKLDGRMHDVSVYFRDYLTEGGVKLPKVLETVVEGHKNKHDAISTHKMSIEHVAVNAVIDDAQFERPLATVAQASAK
jgi:outer membrane lipoprotein-sorting protein